MRISADNFAVLSEHRRWHFIVFFMPIGAQGIPLGLIAVAMAICIWQIAATQFAIYMALSNVGYSAGLAAFGPLLAAVSSHEAVFLVFTGVVITATVTMRQVSITDHIARVREPEADD